MKDLDYERAHLTPDRTRLIIPRPTLIVLCGISGSGKSSFATEHFPPTWVVSSDVLRGVITDDQRNQESSKDAFELMYTIIERRMKFGRTTVADSTALNDYVRKNLLEIAQKHDFQTLLLIFDTPRKLCIEHDAARKEPRPVGPAVIGMQYEKYVETLQAAPHEGFDQIITLRHTDLPRLKVEVTPLSLERPAEHGPFDLIGDIHGCSSELRELLGKLGYRETAGVFRHSAGRRVVFLGDLFNRGPDSPGVVRLVDRMVQAGTALYVRGNHCHYILGYMRNLNGKKYQRPRKWLQELNPAYDAEFRETVLRLVGNSPAYLVLDEGRLIAVHAGLEKDMIGRLSKRIFEFCLYGEETGELNERGYPKRRDWAATYRGKPFIAYGHTPTSNPDPEVRNNTVNLDQGCVYGGRLSAMRYPEMEFVQVQPARVYFSKE